MNVLARSLRYLAKVRFRILGLATIKDIPTEQFKHIAEDLIAAGWRKTYEYIGIDAWIDYGKVKLRKDGVRLTMEWDNWTAGSIEGPRVVIESLGRELGLPVTRAWRWADYDN
jgi:hypothetical protein